jgi:hypothetical protein
MRGKKKKRTDPGAITLGVRFEIDRVGERLTIQHSSSHRDCRRNPDNARYLLETSDHGTRFHGSYAKP